MAASVRTWLVLAALACALTLLLRSADAQAAGPTSWSSSSSPPAKKAGPTSSSSSPSPAKKPVCVPGGTSPCRVGALLRDPENQEEEVMFNVKARAPSGAGDTDSDDDYTDADEPKDPDESSDDDLVVIGH